MLDILMIGHLKRLTPSYILFRPTHLKTIGMVKVYISRKEAKIQQQILSTSSFLD